MTPNLLVKQFMLASLFLVTAQVTAADCPKLLNFTATKLRATEQVDFCQEFAGKAMLVVNTASQCGFTPQFKELEQLHQSYGERLAIVGFPSNDFRQEHSDSQKVAEVCYVNYGVTFTMVEPSSVKGEGANALFKELASISGQQPAWNFNKYLISSDGTTVQHFASNVTPMSNTLIEQIDLLLTEN